MTQEAGARTWGCQAEAGAQLCPLSWVPVGSLGICRDPSPSSDPSPSRFCGAGFRAG